MTRKIIGLSGWAGSGKDTAAEALIADGFTRVSFADKMRAAALALDPIIEVDAWPEYDFEELYIVKETIRLSDLVNLSGWTKAKEFPEVRRTLQRFGTEVGRDLFGRDFWVNIALDTAPEGDIVVTDVRYTNEADAITNRGGTLIRIERPGVVAANVHPSETSLDDYPFPHTVYNNGTVQRLHETMHSVVYDDWAGL